MSRRSWQAPLFLLALLATTDLCANDGEVQTFFRAYVEAFNKQDLDAVSAMWAEKALWIDRETGERTEGRAAIRSDLAEVFKRPAKTRLAGTVDHVRFIKPDVANVEGKTTTSVPGEEPNVSQFSATLVKEGDQWRIASVEEMPVSQPATASDALQELDWLKGIWVDDSKDSPVVSTFRWSPTQSFLIRSFSTKDGDKVAELGTQIIGWDPRSRQIRSWTFNFDGSFGDGVWTKTGKDWSIKSTQTLSDGRAASGTYVISRLGENKLTLRLIGQEVDGEPMPTSEPSSLVRVSDTNKRESKPAK